jgi:polyisoprenoid-binding protein YceI
MKYLLVMSMFAMSAFAADNTFKLDSASKLTWLGKKLGGEHTGLVKTKSGQLVFKDKELKSGEIEVDMATITNTDIQDAKYNSDLVGHLKSEDFFGVDKHPTAKLVIKKVQKISDSNYNVTAELIIKGISKKVSFPAMVTWQDNKVLTKAKLTFDRTQYNIKYKSGKFFQDLGDKIIYDDVTLDAEIVATK